MDVTYQSWSSMILATSTGAFLLLELTRCASRWVRRCFGRVFGTNPNRRGEGTRHSPRAGGFPSLRSDAIAINSSLRAECVQSLAYPRGSHWDQVFGICKTEASARHVPMDSSMAEDLLRWRRQSDYASDDDFTVARDIMKGKQPYWPDNLMKRHIRPVAGQIASTRLSTGIHSGIPSELC